jgi:DinB superfamily
MKIPVSISDRLGTQHLSLSPLVAGLPDDLLERNPLPGKWSIKDNIAHLTKYQLVFIERMHTLLTVYEPVFAAYRAENDPEFVNSLNKSRLQLIDELNEDRITLAGLVSKMNENELKRVGIHSKFGKLSVLDWTEFFLLHEAHHLFTIFRLAHDNG